MKNTVAVLLSLVILCSASWDRKNRQLVQNGTKIHHDGTKIFVTEPNGNSFMDDLNGRQHNTRDSGWIASVWTFDNYSYYSAQWEVPPAPTTSGSEVVFFFNSFDSAQYNDILQPVLQYNNAAPGWTLASWYGNPQGKYYESTPSPVIPGDTITGVIFLQGSTWYIYGYVNGVLKTTISVSYSVISAQGNAQFAMEVYNIDTCSKYPPSNKLNVHNIVLGVNNQQVRPQFTTSINSNSCNAGAGSSDPTSCYITWSS